MWEKEGEREREGGAAGSGYKYFGLMPLQIAVSDVHCPGIFTFLKNGRKRNDYWVVTGACFFTLLVISWVTAVISSLRSLIFHAYFTRAFLSEFSFSVLS